MRGRQIAPAVLAVSACRSRVTLVGPDDVASRLLHGGLEAECAHVDVGQPLLVALFAQLMTSVSNPGRGLGVLRARGLALMLRFRATVGGEVVSGSRSTLRREVARGE